MTTFKQHCSLSYHRSSPDTLDTFAIGVRDGVFSNPTPFATPPITQVDYQGVIDEYLNKRAAYKQGGKAQKGPYQTARTNLITKLDLLADYVDEIADGNEDTILLSGFVPTKAGSTEPQKPGVPAAIELKRGSTTEIFAQCGPVTGAEYYGCIVVGGKPLPEGVIIDENGAIVIRKESEPTPEPEPVGDVPNGAVAFLLDLTKQRTKQFTGLQAHVTYYVYFYAGNPTGVSALSTVQSILCL